MAFCRTRGLYRQNASLLSCFWQASKSHPALNMLYRAPGVSRFSGDEACTILKIAYSTFDAESVNQPRHQRIDTMMVTGAASVV